MKTRTACRRVAALFGVALMAVLSGACGREGEVRRYEEVHVRPPAAPQQPLAAAQPASEVEWQLPEGWTEQPGSGMRLVSFQVGGDPAAGDGSIVVLAGQAGSLEANVRRWVGQLNSSMSAEEATRIVLDRHDPFETAGGQEGVLLDLTLVVDRDVPDAKAMLVGVIPRGQATVFVKLTAPVDTLAAEREAFLQFCRSVK